MAKMNVSQSFLLYKVDQVINKNLVISEQSKQGHAERDNQIFFKITGPFIAAFIRLPIYKHIWCTQCNIYRSLPLPKLTNSKVHNVKRQKG